MTESRAWRILAEEHDSGRTNSEYLCVNLKCATGSPLYYPDYRNKALAKIPAAMREVMVNRIEAALDSNIPAYYEGKDGTCAKLRESRVLACLMFAEQAQDKV